MLYWLKKLIINELHLSSLCLKEEFIEYNRKLDATLFTKKVIFESRKFTGFECVPTRNLLLCRDFVNGLSASDRGLDQSTLDKWVTYQSTSDKSNIREETDNTVHSLEAYQRNQKWCLSYFFFPPRASSRVTQLLRKRAISVLLLRLAAQIRQLDTSPCRSMREWHLMLTI